MQLQQKTRERPWKLQVAGQKLICCVVKWLHRCIISVASLKTTSQVRSSEVSVNRERNPSSVSSCGDTSAAVVRHLCLLVNCLSLSFVVVRVFFICHYGCRVPVVSLLFSRVPVARSCCYVVSVRRRHGYVRLVRGAALGRLSCLLNSCGYYGDGCYAEILRRNNIWLDV